MEITHVKLIVQSKEKTLISLFKKNRRILIMDDIG